MDEAQTQGEGNLNLPLTTDTPSHGSKHRSIEGYDKPYLFSLFDRYAHNAVMGTFNTPHKEFRMSAKKSLTLDEILKTESGTDGITSVVLKEIMEEERKERLGQEPRLLRIRRLP